MPKPVPLPGPFATGPFLAANALAAGVSPGRLRASDLVAPFRGTRAPTSARLSHVELCAAYRERMPASQAFSHLTAARLYDFPLPDHLEIQTKIHVAAQFPEHPPQVRGVVGHRLLRPARLRYYRGFRLVSPIAAWIQLAPVLTHGQLVEVGDFLVKRKHPLVTMDVLAKVPTVVAGLRGANAIRAALLDVRNGTDSPRETRLRLFIVAGGLPEPIVGHRVIDRDGYFVAMPDLAYPHYRVALEYQGAVHQTDRGVYIDDIVRIEQMEDSDWKVVEVVSDHLVNRPHLLIARVAKALVAHGAVLGPLPRLGS